MKILHILKSIPDASTKKIIDAQSAGTQVKIIDLGKGGIAYDRLVADIFAHDKVICW